MYQEPGVPIAVIEAKDNNHTVSQGMQQALGYAEILQVPSVFSSNGDALQVGLTATPKETKYISSSTYFGDPVYTYSLKQGIEGGFLAPYKVVRIDIDKDIHGWTPPPGMTDDFGAAIEQRTYNHGYWFRTPITFVLSFAFPFISNLANLKPASLQKLR